MLSENFNQTTDFVYEVWNDNVDGDPLMGVFDDKGKAGEFAMEQTIGTGGGLVSYYPPIERYTELPPAERAWTLLAEAIIRLETLEADLEMEWPFGLGLLTDLDTDFDDADVELAYDRDAFELVIDEVAWNDAALDLIRAYRTLARARHLRVYDEKPLLTVELELRGLLGGINEPRQSDGE